MRIILFILILLVVALLIAMATGLWSVTQTRPAQAPEVHIGRDGVDVTGGQTPAFDIETGTISVETTTREVPTVTVQPAQPATEPATQPATDPAAPQPQ
jgi:hypothetical protein